MTDEAPRRMIEVGTLPSGYDSMFIAEGGVNPLAVMVRDANARLDAERAEAERKRLAALADIARVQNTRRARAAKRLRQALRMFLRGLK